MTIKDIQNKIESFKQRLPEYTDETKLDVEQWEKNLDDIERIEDTIRNPVIKEMVVDYAREIEAINYRLCNEEKMKEIDRQGLFADKRACQRFVDTFDIEGRKEALYKTITELTN